MSKLKLLIAEDSKSMQYFYQTQLSADHFEIKIVPDGEQALTEYQAWRPDIILLDMNMPLMNGYQALKGIRDTHRDKSTTIIMVTSASEKDAVIACAKLGIQGYIVKPFRAETLNSTILLKHQQKR